jgi:hypothetical protein
MEDRFRWHGLARSDSWMLARQMAAVYRFDSKVESERFPIA